MFNNKTFLAIIPARGGSKRLPNKNIRDLCGKPLISWTINSALKSQYIDEIVVSSDSDNILKIASYFNVKAQKRPSCLSTDDSSSVDVVLDSLKKSSKFDYVIVLQPTSPLRNNENIDEAIELLVNKNADAVISVCQAPHPPFWSNKLDENLSMENFLSKDSINKRSQDFDKYYTINGAIYICDTEIVNKLQTLFPEKNIFAYVMDRELSIDIDEEIDFLLCESYCKNTKNIFIE